MHKDDRVIAEKFDGFAIILANGGYYRETLISNFTNSNIVVVGNNNGRTTITPDSPQGNGTVVITVRTHNGKRHAANAEIPLPTERYTIPRELVERGHYYLKECDVLIATPGVGKTITHPNANKSYEDLLEEVVAATIAPNVTRLLFSINDPLGRADHVYGCISGHCFKIPCSHIRGEGLSNLITTIADNKETNRHDKVSIEDLFVEGSTTVPLFDNMLSIGLTANDALECYNNKEDKNNAEIADKITKRVTAQRRDAEKQHEQELHKLNLVIEDLKIKVSSLKCEKGTLDSKILELNDMLLTRDELLAKWESLRVYENDKHKHEQTRKTADSKLHEQEHKTARARWQATSEPTKVVITIVGIIVSAVVGAIIKEVVESK